MQIIGEGIRGMDGPDSGCGRRTQAKTVTVPVHRVTPRSARRVEISDLTDGMGSEGVSGAEEYGTRITGIQGAVG